MRTKLVPVGVMILAMVVLSACSGAIQAAGDEEQTDIGVVEQVAIDASYDDQEVEVAAGNLLVVTLESNATTGFRWQLSEPIDEGMLALIQSKYMPGEDAEKDSPVVGAGGTEVWTFEALTAGKVATISMEYSRPWEGGEKGARTFDVTVVIK